MKVYVLFFCLLVSVSCASKPAASSTNPTPVTNSSPLPLVNSTPASDPFELTRDKVLALARSRINKEVEALFDLCECGRHNPQSYEEMIRAKIIECDDGPVLAPNKQGFFNHCKPGSNAGKLRINPRSGEMTITAGHRVPSEVLGISKVDQSSAIAEVALKFESSAGFGPVKRWFDQFQDTTTFRQINTGNEQHRIYLRLYDDGWRIERID